MSEQQGSSPESEKFSGVKPVDPRYALDEARLADYLRSVIPDFAGPLAVSQFKGGQSNPTYRLRTPERGYVLRRKPPGKLLPSAHAVDREFRIISALHPLGFPVARPFCLCEDDSVIGSAFYVMEEVAGRILWDATMPGVDSAHRRAVYEAQIRTLAQLHLADWEKAGLADFGKTGSYYVRQIGRWTKQYQASETALVEPMNRLIEWLPTAVPSTESVAIVHGDYRLDNMILDPEKPEIRAVLDWELSTLGDPLADFTYYLMQWVMPKDVRGLAGADIEALGIPSIPEAAALYCALTGRAAVPALEFYFSYNLFRLAAICQGIVGRVRDGTAASAEAASMGARVAPLAEAAWAYARAAGA